MSNGFAHGGLRKVHLRPLLATSSNVCFEEHMPIITWRLPCCEEDKALPCAVRPIRFGNHSLLDCNIWRESSLDEQFHRASETERTPSHRGAKEVVCTIRWTI